VKTIQLDPKVQERNLNIVATKQNSLIQSHNMLIQNFLHSPADSINLPVVAWWAYFYGNKILWLWHRSNGYKWPSHHGGSSSNQRQATQNFWIANWSRFPSMYFGCPLPIISAPYLYHHPWDVQQVSPACIILQPHFSVGQTLWVRNSIPFITILPLFFVSGY